MSIKIIDIIERIKTLKGLHYDVEVAKILGISKENLYNHKSKNAIPYERLIALCEREGIPIVYLLYGTDKIPTGIHIGMKCDPDKEINRNTQLSFQNLPPDVRQAMEDGKEPESTVQCCHGRTWEIYKDIKDILESDNESLKDALTSCIKECIKSIQKDQRIQDLEETVRRIDGDLQQLKELANLELQAGTIRGGGTGKLKKAI
jgi:hypothetical protein